MSALPEFDEYHFKNWAIYNLSQKDDYFARKVTEEDGESFLESYCSTMELICLLGEYLTIQATSKVELEEFEPYKYRPKSTKDEAIFKHCTGGMTWVDKSIFHVDFENQLKAHGYHIVYLKGEE